MRKANPAAAELALKELLQEVSVFGYFDLVSADRTFGTFHRHSDYIKAVRTHHFLDMLF